MNIPLVMSNTHVIHFRKGVYFTVMRSSNTEIKYYTFPNSDRKKIAHKQRQTRYLTHDIHDCSLSWLGNENVAGLIHDNAG